MAEHTHAATLRTSEESILRVMRVLEATPSLSQRDLATQTGMSLGSLNYCLKALMAKGLVKMQRFAQSSNKFGYAYVLTPSGISEKATITYRFLQRKLAEYEMLKNEIENLRLEVKNSEGWEPNCITNFIDSGS